MIDAKVLRKLSNIHVLIVEDDEMTAYVIKQSLSFHCKKVDIANNGIEGFEMYESKKPDVVIADINMPEMNGLEMVKALHEISPHLPVIIMTSYDNSENMLESINQGAYSYLRKPIKIEELQTALLMATKDIYNSNIELEENFHYECNTKTLFKEHRPVKLTKTQKELVHLLMSNINKVVDFTTIESYVWQEKSMSIEALRMCIKKIRTKTYLKLIESVPGSGYIINSKK
ncbi:response regulator transcription factor [Malaciobacter mytili]|uniref:Two-component system response regulator n=1 Tax=Malaciobacter mytili LMG 24559 TaxID=1032238 RepID=A0AAX2AKU0_9BACT|nr:response regulator transcription factor [Malaciobacter mytili]AXH14125.1 two-component system response regulator [Malaciobacter mytili LMG 24559]RXK17001.1 two-component system response regulator [Malaciobacter mytili LMG 24559]